MSTPAIAWNPRRKHNLTRDLLEFHKAIVSNGLVFRPTSEFRAEFKKPQKPEQSPMKRFEEHLTRGNQLTPQYNAITIPAAGQLPLNIPQETSPSCRYIRGTGDSQDVCLQRPLGPELLQCNITYTYIYIHTYTYIL